MTNSSNLESEFKYKNISISDFFKFGQSKIDEIIKTSNFNNINLIQTKGNFIYHIRHLNEKEEFINPKWFVHKPHDLLVVFLYRMWQNGDFDNEKINIDKVNYYKQNLSVDVYYTKKPLNLIKFDNQQYYKLENVLQTIEPKYERCWGFNKGLDNIEIANWLKDNKNIVNNLDGWFEKSNDEIREQNWKRIDEIMILPSAKEKIDLVYTKPIDKIIEFDVIK